MVVGTLDLNQCYRLPDEITGKKPEVIYEILELLFLDVKCPSL